MGIQQPGEPSTKGKGLRTGCSLEGGKEVPGATVSAGNQATSGRYIVSPLLPFSGNYERDIIWDVKMGRSLRINLSGPIPLSYR